MNIIIKHQVTEHLELSKFLLENQIDKIIEVAKVISSSISLKNKILLFGNGGSAADAQHIAAEFTGRFVKERRALPAVALTTDTSALTAIGNDYGFDTIFERQIQALAQKGDILIGISTSGNSLNVIKGFEIGKSIGCETISLTGNSGGKLKDISKYNININSASTARVQEMHILIGHLICSIVDNDY
jgi:D-sedoheptulose 7-phosphate isomerase